MRGTRRPSFARPLLAAASLLALTACGSGGFDMDMRDLGRAFDTTEAARSADVAPRPKPDDRGVISYASYQVAVARRGDTVADVAQRLGLDPIELARYNGIPEGAVLNRGEILALPRRVDAAAQTTSAVLPAGETVDVTTLAGAAIDRADTGAGVLTPAAARAGPEPQRHRVERGETAFSIARKYGVSPDDLAGWNGLGPDLALREGQHLMIPVVLSQPQAPTEPTAPGTGTRTPVPPSAAHALPDEEPAPVTETASGPAAIPQDAPESPDLGATATAASATGAAMQMPVTGAIIRDFRKGRSEGIDIAAAAGTPVRAAASGKVAAITRDTDQVPILVLRHDDGLLTVYANVDDLKVNKGDTVAAGQQIAAIRASDPAFLHFEVRDGLEAVDPNDYLN